MAIVDFDKVVFGGIQAMTVVALVLFGPLGQNLLVYKLFLLVRPTKR
jgi:hypothetical protein